MPVLVGLPLVIVLVVVFAVVLAAILLIESRGHTGQSAGRVREYTTISDSSELSVESLASRQRGRESVLEHLLAFAAVTAPQRLRSAATADLARAGVSMSPSVFLGIRGVLLLGAPLLGLLWVLSSPEKGPVQWGFLAML